MSNNENPQATRPAVYLFNAKDLGQSLREVAVEHIQSDGNDIESRWYHSKKDADLFLWRDKNKNIIKQQVTFYGQLVEWNVIEGLRTGMLIDEVGAAVNNSPIIRYDVEPHRHAVEQGIEIVGHIPNLSNHEKSQIIEMFAGAQVFGELNPSEIVRRFGIHQNVKNNRYSHAFQRLRNFLGLLFKKK